MSGCVEMSEPPAGVAAERRFVAAEVYNNMGSWLPERPGRNLCSDATPVASIWPTARMTSRWRKRLYDAVVTR
jgi:hypothetical protein